MQDRRLIEAIIEGELEEASQLAREYLDEGIPAREIMDNHMIPAMGIVGEKFETKEYFVPEVLVSAHAMKAALEFVEPVLASSEGESMGRVVIGTVKGDLHDIGKNIVAMMLQGAGFLVTNLGANVEPELFVKTVKEQNANILGMSSLLTTAMSNMQETVDLLVEEGIRDQVRVDVDKMWLPYVSRTSVAECLRSC